MCPLVSYTKPEPRAVAFCASLGLFVKGGFSVGISGVDEGGGADDGISDVI